LWKNQISRVRGMAKVVEHLPSKFKVLSSKPQNHKKKNSVLPTMGQNLIGADQQLPPSSLSSHYLQLSPQIETKCHCHLSSHYGFFSLLVGFVVVVVCLFVFSTGHEFRALAIFLVLPLLLRGK
jgi:hypothetical protein